MPAYTLQNNTPSAGCIQWSNVHMSYNGNSYAITNGYTNCKYIYWLAATPSTFVVSNTFPTLGISDALVFLNKSGVALVVPDATVLDGGLIVPGSIYADAIAANTITSAKIAADAITASQLATGCVTADAVAANAIGAAAIAAGTITGDKLIADAITSREIAAGAVSTSELHANAITAASGIIADAAITTAKIADAQITNAKIASIDASKITSGTINATTKITQGTAGGARSEQYVNSGSPVYDYYNSANIKTRSDTPAGIDFYDALGAVSTRIATTTADATITVGVGKDYATIQAAVNSVPAIIAHIITIVVYAGTYNETVSIKKRDGGGSLEIRANTGDVVNVTKFVVMSCYLAYLKIKGITITSTDDHSIFATNASFIILDTLDLTASATSKAGAYFYRGCKGHVTGCTVSNKFDGVLSQYGCEIIVSSTGGSGNYYGLDAAYGAIIDGVSNTITGTVPRYSAQGGQIFPSGGLQLLGPDTWHTPTFVNGWQDYGSPYSCGYKKDSMGFVHLRGMVKGGVSGTQAFVLPAGYRPAQTIEHGTLAHDVYGFVYINSAGSVQPNGDNAYVSFDGVTFEAV